MATRGKKSDLSGQKAQLIDHDPRDGGQAAERKETRKDAYAELVSWLMGRVSSWKDHRRANYEGDWDRYERLWRAIYSTQERERKSERAHIISPALSEAVENAVSEMEEAVFGRGEFFGADAEAADPEIFQHATSRNEKQLREDLAQTDFAPNVGEILLGAAVFGTGVGELVVEEREVPEIVPQRAADGSVEAGVIRTERVYTRLNPVPLRNFIIDPNARSLKEAMGCAVEEGVGSHIIKAGQEDGTYRDVELTTSLTDYENAPDPQTKTQYERDSVDILRYYGLVPKHLLSPKNFDEDGKEVREETDPLDATMVEAVVVIANQQVCLLAEESPYLMGDRPIVAFRWDVVPGRFYGRGVCEKGQMMQRLLDAELRSRMDALAFSAAPMMGMDATRIPRGFQLNVYPGKSILTNGDPSTVLKPMRFGEMDQNSWQQAQMLDQFVQRATGAIDSVSMAQRGAGGEARSGAVSMAMSGIVKRNKRTMMRFVNEFLAPAIQKMLWRGMQFDPQRYLPLNTTFSVNSTMGIMQREYETQNLAQVLAGLEPGSPEHLMVLSAIIDNSGIPQRRSVVQMLQQRAQMAMQAAQAQAMQTGEAPVDPVQQQLAMLDAQLELAQKEAEIAKIQAQARLYNAQAQTEAIEPQLQLRETMLKGVYAEEETRSGAFDRRMRMADQLARQLDIASNERIAQTQMQGALLKEAMRSRTERAKVATQAAANVMQATGDQQAASLPA